MLKTNRNKFGRTRRLAKQRDFDHAFCTGQRFKMKGLTFLKASNERDHPRLGISIGKSFGNAVERNRMKRRLREAFRLGQDKWPAVDLICVPYRLAMELTVGELKELLEKVCEHSKPVTENK
ncbi:MAG: ribonuclease P protein component [Phycisphaerae bacterium]